MRKYRDKVIVFIIIIVAVRIVYNRGTVPYNEVLHDIERRVKDGDNSIVDLNIKKKLNKYSDEYFLCSVKYENNYAKEKYLLVIYKKDLFDRYIDSILELNNHCVGRYCLEDKNVSTYAVYGYNPNKIISNFKTVMDNETVIEDISEEDYFIKVYKGDLEFGMYDWTKFYDKDGKELSTELIISQ
ncbi:hypothetical protein SH2C18_19750 [Clostridium sediminicola]|uniref:hypothetical protein n=1 Tax=Clostridium sediminicola TaxID=3114879 RepID=UPI0031F1EDAD